MSGFQRDNKCLHRWDDPARLTGEVQPLEKWGGAECTVNRVGDAFIDQLAETGHHERESDVALIAGLGVKRVRFPILWERTAPRPGQALDWSWSDRRLELLKEHGIEPIAGLLHHGSGPPHTSLIDPEFAAKLASYAGLVAERYSWIADWTPVNEPLTTARFSALYGVWYPHARDERTFWTALLNQVDGIRLAMRAVRAVHPGARLVQTEDLGRTYATRGVGDQAAFDNERRWATWDLLCGMVGPDHPLWPHVCSFGLRDRLEAIRDDPCPPEIIGIDHYLTSDRLLDESVERYPATLHGGNGQARYADVEALRVLTPAPHGLKNALLDTWQRYGRPIAITEVHNGCSREEQVRWFDEAWRTALEVRLMGVDLRAVTAWALFGNRGWNTLLTERGEYEAGAFDVSSGTPRPTALAEAVRHPGAPRLVGGVGWWRRDQRLQYPGRPRPAPMAEHRASRASARTAADPILILGATGTLGRALAGQCTLRHLNHRLAGRNEVDLLDPRTIERTLEDIRPWAVINAAGWVRVDDAEDQPEACHAVNATGALNLARMCGDRGIPTVNFSSDLVFGGSAGGPYLEHDTIAPLNAYGRSKAAMEAELAALPGTHLVIRTAAFFSPFDEHNFALHCVQALARGATFETSADCVVSPTYVPDLCRATLDLLLDREGGIWHLTNGEGLTWFEFACRLADAAGLPSRRIIARSDEELGWRAPRPRACALGSARGRLMPSLGSAIERFTTVATRKAA